MEESFEELYNKFLDCRKRKIKELVEVQDQLTVAGEVNCIKAAQEKLCSLLIDTDSPMSAAKLSEEIRENAAFMLDIMGLGKEQMVSINSNQNRTLLPESNPAIEVKKIGMIESVDFED